MSKGVAKTHTGPQEPPKRGGRPKGTTIPPETYKGHIVRANVTEAQAEKWKRLGGPKWLRWVLDLAPG